MNIDNLEGIMSEEVVQFIIGRAVTDTEYRELLFTDPDQALAGYDLTEEEAASLKDIDRGEFESNLSELEDRISRAGLGFGDFLKMSSPDKYRGLGLGASNPPPLTSDFRCM